ncbi:MAG: TolC family protein [Sulfitobacter sp.]|jgi:cobalt-zinc-cadmium efflux system outer membrane protein|tara:strand:- start:141 stop:1472 length:1332 start_codon:yes stop_codon:yes gene_type:complete
MPFTPHFHAHKKPIGDRFLSVFSGLRHFLQFCLVAIGAFGITAHAQAQSELTLPEAIEKSLTMHPEIAVMQYRAKGLQGQIEQAAVGATPELMLTVEDALGSGNYEAFDSAQTTLSISWVLQGNLIDDRIKAAQGKATVLDIENRIRQFDIAAQTGREFVQLLALQERLNVETRSLNNARKALKDISRKVDAGRLPVSDRLRAEVNVQNRELALEDIEHEILSAQRLLAAQWGETNFQFNRVSGALTKLPQVQSFSSLEDQLKSSPETQWFLTQERALDAEIALAKSEARRRLQFNTGVRHYQESDDFGAVLTMSLPLGGEKRNRGKIASFTANQNRIQSEAAANQVVLRAKLFSLHQELLHSQHIVQTLENKILPKLKAAEKELRDGFQLGKYSYSEWSIVQNELVEANLRLIETSVVAHLNAIEIERLTGQSLSTFKTSNY